MSPYRQIATIRKAQPRRKGAITINASDGVVRNCEHASMQPLATRKSAITVANGLSALNAMTGATAQNAHDNIAMIAYLRRFSSELTVFLRMRFSIAERTIPASIVMTYHATTTVNDASVSNKIAHMVILRYRVACVVTTVFRTVVTASSSSTPTLVALFGVISDISDILQNLSGSVRPKSYEFRVN